MVMKDCRFYCCTALQKQLAKEDHYEYEDLHISGYSFCPYCGSKLR